MKRTEKIKLLKGLLSGEKSINDLVLRKPRIFSKREENNYFMDTETKKQYFVNENDLKKLFPRNPILIIHFTRTIIRKKVEG